MAEAAVIQKPVTPQCEQNSGTGPLQLGQTQHTLQQSKTIAGFNAQKQMTSNSAMIEESLALQQQFQHTQNSCFIPQTNSNGQGKVSPPNQGVHTEGSITRIYDGDHSVFTMNQVIATSGEVQRMGNAQQRGSKQRSKFPPNPNGTDKQYQSTHNRVSSNPSKPSAEPAYQISASHPQQQNHNLQMDQYQTYNMFHPSQLNGNPNMQQFSQTQQAPMLQQPPQIHYIAKQQKFYQISPSRGTDVVGLQVGQVPIMFDKRPYTSSSVQQVMNKRSSGNKVHNSAIAALYLANSKANATSGMQNPNRTELFSSQTSQMQGTPYQPPKKRLMQNLSVPRKNPPSTQVFTQLDHEQLFEEAIKLKQTNYDLRDENGRLKARIKMQDTELVRKDKAIEDFYQQNQFIQQAQSKAGGLGAQLAPIAATTQKYQQETFLLMSLKKQVKGLKAELQKKDEQVSQLLKISKVAKYADVQQELDLYKEELSRLQGLLETQCLEQQKVTDHDSGVSSAQLKPESQASQLERPSELGASESNQAHVIAPGQLNQSQMIGSVDQLHDSHLLELLQERDLQIQELQNQLTVIQSLQKPEVQQPGQSLDQLKSELARCKKVNKESSERLLEKDKTIKSMKQAETSLDAKLKEMEQQVKSLSSKMTSFKDASKLKDEKISEKELAVQQLEKKNKSLKDTINKLQINKETANSNGAPKTSKEEAQVMSKAVESELSQVVPILACNQKISDRLTMASELKHGLGVYTPSPAVTMFLKETSVADIALSLPNLTLQKARLEHFTGDVGDRVKCDFTHPDLKVNGGEAPTLSQRQFLMARYLADIQSCEVFVNTVFVAEDLEAGVGAQHSRKKSVDEEQMLDIAELCFVKMADVLIKHGITIREAFAKYAIPELLPESKTVLELLVPEAFFEAIKIELRIKEFSDLEAACLMRVLAKPELDNAIILNEFALIMENFGVPLIDGTISDEEDYVPDGQVEPLAYDLKNIDEEGIQILQDVAKNLLKEYQHPREFFGKMVKNNVEIKTEKKMFKVDTLAVKDFYLKIKIANIRKTLQQNTSLNSELCLDPVTHATVFNMKTFVRALEDIAEVEQEKIFDQERAIEQKMMEEEKEAKEKAEGEAQKSPTDKQPAKLSSALAPGPFEECKASEEDKLASDYNDKASLEIKQEVVRFGKGNGKSRRSPKPQSKFQALGTIDEAVNETATSQQQELSVKDDESKLGSNNLRNSNQIDFEESGGTSHHKDSLNRVDLLNRSLSGRGDPRNPDLGKSMRSDQPGQTSTEQLPPTEEAYNWSAKSGKSDKAANLTPKVFEQQDDKVQEEGDDREPHKVDDINSNESYEDGLN